MVICPGEKHGPGKIMDGSVIYHLMPVLQGCDALLFQIHSDGCGRPTCATLEHVVQ
jgi:hypothetical protein